MRRIGVDEDVEKGTTSVTFTFDAHDSRELREIGSLFQVARSLTSAQGRLAVEIEAHLAYFDVLERGARCLAKIGFQPDPPLPSEGAGDG